MGNYKYHICPLCNKQFKFYKRHKCEEKINANISEDEFKIKCLEYELNINGFTINDIITDYTNLYSLPDIRNKYNLDFKTITFILVYNNIHIRTISESHGLITIKKSKETCLKKYGVENPSQSQEIKNKKANTFLKKYGVDNIWKTKEYAEFTSNRWKSYTPEEKTRILGKWTKKRGRISNLELKVIDVFNLLNISITTQFKFSNYYHKYDIKINNTNILLEINGDYWHANPILYKETDILKFSKNINYTAKDIWDKDKKHYDIAKKHNYNVIYIWENDISKYSIEELRIYILNLLNELNYGKTETLS